VSTATRIEWTEVTWNPTTGCDRISPGCEHCYALTLAKRLKAMGQPKYQRDGDPRTSGPGFGVTMHADVLAEPLRWRTPPQGVRELDERRRACPCRALLRGADMGGDGPGPAAHVPGAHQAAQAAGRDAGRSGVHAPGGEAATEIIGRTPHRVWRMPVPQPPPARHPRPV